MPPAITRLQAVLIALAGLLLLDAPAGAAPYAALVMDARDGAVLYRQNADTRLNPASLTKMMTLYVAFEAIEHGEIDPTDPVAITPNAASEPPVELGLRAGSEIELRYLIRAAAVASSNDAATAIAEGVSGSEAAFVARMNDTAREMGLTDTHFRNSHGLTQSGHYSSARDMGRLGRHLVHDYPGYYNLFSRMTADAGLRRVSHSNRRFLGAYPGADGIKTGYTRAAGYNLVGSAKRAGVRLIGVIFGATSSADRTRRMSDLLDRGFEAASSYAALRPPSIPAYQGGVVSSSIRPRRRPAGPEPQGLDAYRVMAERRVEAAEAFAAITGSRTPSGSPVATRAGFTAVAIPRPGQAVASPGRGGAGSVAGPVGDRRPAGAALLAAAREGEAIPMGPRRGPEARATRNRPAAPTSGPAPASGPGIFNIASAPRHETAANMPRGGLYARAPHDSRPRGTLPGKASGPASERPIADIGAAEAVAPEPGAERIAAEKIAGGAAHLDEAPDARNPSGTPKRMVTPWKASPRR